MLVTSTQTRKYKHVESVVTNALVSSRKLNRIQSATQQDEELQKKCSSLRTDGHQEYHCFHPCMDIILPQITCLRLMDWCMKIGLSSLLQSD